MTRNSAWMQTFSGVKFYPLEPLLEEIHIEDIAHSLALQCRFVGHCKRYYSVAQHSVMVSRICPPQDALWGLLHDASEAYLVDLPRPIKRYTHIGEEYRRIESSLMGAITQRFGLPPDEPESVTRADKIMLGIEARDIMSPLQLGWEKWLEMIGDRPERIDPWSAERAEEEFLVTAEVLGIISVMRHLSM